MIQDNPERLERQRGYTHVITTFIRSMRRQSHSPETEGLKIRRQLRSSAFQQHDISTPSIISFKLVILASKLPENCLHPGIGTTPSHRGQRPHVPYNKSTRRIAAAMAGLRRMMPASWCPLRATLFGVVGGLKSDGKDRSKEMSILRNISYLSMALRSLDVNRRDLMSQEERSFVTVKRTSVGRSRMVFGIWRKVESSVGG